MDKTKAESCIEKIPDVACVRAELARNHRERSLLKILLQLAERKAAFAQLNIEAESDAPRARSAQRNSLLIPY